MVRTHLSFKHAYVIYMKKQKMTCNEDKLEACGKISLCNYGNFMVLEY